MSRGLMLPETPGKGNAAAKGYMADWSASMGKSRSDVDLEWLKRLIDERRESMASAPSQEGELDQPTGDAFKDDADDEGIVRVGEHTYVVAEDGKLIPADYQVKLTFGFSALEAQRLRAYAKRHRKSVRAVVREALAPIIRDPA